MSAKNYAMSHNISPYSLKNWAHKIQEEGLEIEWRTHLHPSARSKISSGSSSAAKGDEANHGLTNTSTLEPEQEGRLNRRRFTEDEKRAIAEESATGKESAAEVCRRHGIVTSMLFRWRVQFGYSAGGKVRLVPVSLKSDGGSASTQPAILHDLIKAPDGMMTVDLGDGRRVFAPVGSDVDEVRRQATSAGGA